MQDWLIVVWKVSIHALPRQPDHRSPPLGSCRCPFRGRPLIVVFGPPPCPRWPNLHPPSQLSSSCRHPCCGRATTAEVVAAQLWQRSDGSTAMAEKVAAQQWRWQRSNGNDGAAMAMAAQRLQRRRSDCNGGAAIATAAQQRLRKCSNGNVNGGAAMGVAVVVAAQQ